MKKFMKSVGLMALAAAVLSGSAYGSEYLFQFDDAEPLLTGNTYQDGQLIQSVTVGEEQYLGDYGLWHPDSVDPDVTLVQDLSVNVNIYDPNGDLSDTWQLFGVAGDSRVSIPFISDTEGGPALTPLDNAISMTENGDWQTVADFVVSNGDHYTWQFRSDLDPVGVPEPSTIILIAIGGLSMFGVSRRSRK